MTSKLIKKAIYYAAEKHDGQYRKGIKKIPYLVHSVLVGFDISKYTDDEDVITSAILHDVIEDCGVTTKELTREFNSKISKIVTELSSSKSSNNKPWKEKKKDYLSLVSKASEEACLIIAIDKMQNMEAYFDHAVAGHIELLEESFGGKIKDYLWYYEEILKILESKIKNQPITNDYKKMFLNYKNKLSKK